MYSLILELVKWGIGNTDDAGEVRRILSDRDNPIDWEAVKEASHNQKILAIVYDGIDRIYSTGVDLDIPKTTLRKWYGNAFKYAESYAKYTGILAKLADFYDSIGCKMLLLKGYGLGLDYPDPVHRPCGDVDIYLFGRQKEADKLISEKCGVIIDNSHSIHSVFNIKGITIENHYRFFNPVAHRSNARINSMLEAEAVPEKCRLVTMNGSKFFIPGANFNALYILRHSGQHFAAVEIHLRHLLDWGMFVKAHGSEVDWNWLEEKAAEFNMNRFFHAQNAICVDYLGFPESIFPRIERDYDLECRILDAILNPEFTETHPKGLLKTLLWKWRRWRKNLWKHRIIYNESPFCTFFSQLASHFSKPKTFKI